MMSDPRHPHVLVVDDDADTRELYHIILESVGYKVASAATVRALAEHALPVIPHVVVTDWRLPDGDGFAVSDVVQARSAWRHVPLVAVTGITMMPEMAADARRRGFTEVLVKPASPDDILHAVRAADEIGTARRVRAAALRFRRYGAAILRNARREPAATRSVLANATQLVERAASRAGDDITLMLADDSAQYVAAGGRTRELTGYDPQELLSLHVWDLTPLPAAASGQGLWKSFIASGSQEGRYTLRRRDGAAVEAQYCAIANVIPGLHVSALAEASQIAVSL